MIFKAELCEDQKGILFSFFMFAIQSELSQNSIQFTVYLDLQKINIV